MKKIGAIIIGSWLVFSGIQALFNGNTIGIGTVSIGANQIYMDKNPIEFFLVVFCLDFGFGLYLIKVGLSSKGIE